VKESQRAIHFARGCWLFRGKWSELDWTGLDQTHIGVAVHTQTLNLLDDFGFRVTFGGVAGTVDAFDPTTHVLEKFL